MHDDVEIFAYNQAYGEHRKDIDRKAVEKLAVTRKTNTCLVFERQPFEPSWKRRK